MMTMSGNAAKKKKQEKKRNRARRGVRRIDRVLLVRCSIEFYRSEETRLKHPSGASQKPKKKHRKR